MFTGFVAIFYLSNCQRWDNIIFYCFLDRSASSVNGNFINGSVGFAKKGQR